MRGFVRAIYINNQAELFWSMWRIRRTIKRINKDRWSHLRKLVIAKYGAECMKCGSRERINVDHIKPKSKYPELQFDLNNLQILCWPCNKEKGNKYVVDYRTTG